MCNRLRVKTGRMVALAIVVLVLGGLGTGATPAAPGKGLIILVRHAERSQAAASDDPPLTDAGNARAQRLAAMLAKSRITTVFVTRFQRTQETARPLADLLKLTPIDKSDSDQLIAELRTRGSDTVLVVGHSDTVPDVIKAFGGPTVTIDDDDFDDLFVLVPATGALARFKY